MRFSLRRWRWRVLTCLLALLLGGSFVSAQENCANGIDDDGDGLVDLNDSVDCPCTHILVVDSSVNSLIANPSFELYDSLPTALSQLDRCVGWAQASTATTDYYNAQSYVNPNIPLPLPDGDAYVGFLAIYLIEGPNVRYAEYVGTNLLQPLQAGVPYVLRFYIAGGGLVDTLPFSFVPPWFGHIDITLFGYSTPVVFPAFELGCPATFGWTEIGHATYQAEPHWSVLTIAFTPTTDMAAIMLGPPCEIPADHMGRYEPEDTLLLGVNWPYYLMDDLVLNTLDQFTGVILPSGGLCAHDLLLTAYAPPGTVSYQWYLNGVALVGETDSTLAVSVAMGPGQYTCVVLNSANDCLAIDHFVAPEPFLLDLDIAPTIGCEPLEVEFLCSTDVQSLTWHFDDGSSAQGDSLVHTYAQAGIYDDLSVEYTALSGCSYTAPLNELITVHPRPAIDIAVGMPGPYSPGDVVPLQGVGVDADHWSWTFGNIAPYVVLNTSATSVTLPGASGEYDIILYASNVFGCLDTAYVRLVVQECNAGSVYVPSAFSPNGSGKNDLLCVYGNCIITMVLNIYDRWGNKVFESTDPMFCWDGLHNGAPLDAGVFVYHLIATLATGEQVEKQGNITLVR